MEVEKQQAVVSGIMSSIGFDTLELSAQTRKAIDEMGFAHMTEVQARTIPQLLTGRDVLGAAKTGQCCTRPASTDHLFPCKQACSKQSAAS